MRVSELQQFLREVAVFAEATGATKLAVLKQTVECLQPFSERTLDDFARFLRVADEYERTGVVSEAFKPKKERKPREPKAPKPPPPPKLTVAEAAQIFFALKERTTDPTLDFAYIDSEINKIASLTVPELKKLAKEVHRTLPSKAKKDEIIDSFRQMIKDQKENFQRNRLQAPQTVSS